MLQRQTKWLLRAASQVGTMSMKRTDALIAIVGATGTGKSQLAIDLALQFNGEVINSDAMQIYKGLPVITNKVTIEEQRGVRHHLLGCVGLEREPWRVDTFVTNALAAIEDIRRRGKLPILVGGTHYYVQSLLFKNTLAVESDDGDENGVMGAANSAGAEASSRWPILEGPTSEMLEKLQQVDPVMAARWHPNDRRRIRRSLEIWLVTGKRASDVYAEQAQRKSGAGAPAAVMAGGEKSSPSPAFRHDDHNNSDGAESANSSEQSSPFTLRYPTLLLWTHTNMDILRERLDRRVEQMGANDGLIEEALELYQLQKEREARGDPLLDTTRGIFVAVGYRQFLKYLDAQWQGKSCSGSSSNNRVEEAEVERLKQEGYELTKTATRQYAKKQQRWIRIKLINAMRDARAQQNVFVLNTSQPVNWEEATRKPAIEYASVFLQGGVLPRDNNLHLTDMGDITAGGGSDNKDLARNPALWERHTCDVCNVTAVTKTDWACHIQSRRHKKMTRKTMKRKQDVVAAAGLSGDAALALAHSVKDENKDEEEGTSSH